MKKGVGSRLHVLYLPGFNDDYDRWRLRLLGWWRFPGVTVELVSMKWDGKETFEQKIARIDQAMDRAKNKHIVLLGESAGGSMVVHMYARRPDDVHKVVTLCGKNSHPETVGESYYRRSPAFRSSMERLNESIGMLTMEKRRRFISVHPLYDSVVPVRETLLPGCQRIRLWSVGHFITIITALTIFSPLLIRLVRK